MVTILCQKQHAEIGFRCLKNNDFDIEDKNTLAHWKNLKMKNWKPYVMKTHVRCKLNLQTHLELITQWFWNVWKHIEFKSKDVKYRVSWSWETSNSILSPINSCFNGRKGKVFCIVSWLAMKSGYNNLKHRRSLGKPSHVSTSVAKPNIHDSKLPYLPTPPLRQDMTQGQLFKRSLTGLNSEFSFS